MKGTVAKGRSTARRRSDARGSYAEKSTITRGCREHRGRRHLLRDTLSRKRLEAIRVSARHPRSIISRGLT
jgi:hypothetical protein